MPSYKKYLIITVVLSFFVSCTIKDAEFKNEKENRKYLKVEEKKFSTRRLLHNLCFRDGKFKNVR